MKGQNSEIGPEKLLEEGNLETSSSQFIEELRQTNLTDEEKDSLWDVRATIILQHQNGSHGGHGFLSSSSKPDREKELKATRYVADCFKESNVYPVIVPIDEFYRFDPGNISLARKTKTFNNEIIVFGNELAQELNPNKRFAIILSDFYNSEIFQHKILEQVPVYENAGFKGYLREPEQIGRELLDFSYKTLPQLVENAEGI